MHLLHELKSRMDVDAISAVRMFSRLHESCFQMLSELNKIGSERMSSGSYIHVPLLTSTSDISSKSGFNRTSKLPLIWTFHLCFSKVLHTNNCLWQRWLVSQSQGVISDLLILDLHTHTTVDIQCWISFCSILKETCNFYESQVRWVPLPGHTLSPDRSLL